MESSAIGCHCLVRNGFSEHSLESRLQRAEEEG